MPDKRIALVTGATIRVPYHHVFDLTSRAPVQAVGSPIGVEGLALAADVLFTAFPA